MRPLPGTARQPARGRQRGGFTLTEVLTVVIIISILAMVAVPSYRKVIEQGYLREAQDLLMTIYNGERAYSFTNNGQYHAPTSSLDWRTIYMDNPNLASIPVQFSVVVNNAAVPPTFTATATRTGCAGASMTINHNRTMSAPWNPGSC